MTDLAERFVVKHNGVFATYNLHGLSIDEMNSIRDKLDDNMISIKNRIDDRWIYLKSLGLDRKGDATSLNARKALRINSRNYQFIIRFIAAKKREAADDRNNSFPILFIKVAFETLGTDVFLKIKHETNRRMEVRK